MKNLSIKVLLVLGLVFSSYAAFSQAGEIRIRFIGNAGLYLTDGKLNVYIDFPYKSGAFGYMKYAPKELDSIKANATFIFTHWHPDHYSKKLVRKHTGNEYGPWNVEDQKTVAIPGQGFTVQAFRTKHRFAHRHNSYLITWHGKKIFISGDTESPETIGRQAGLDWAFVPSWILFGAREKNIKIDAKNIGIYHLYPNEKYNVVTPGIVLMDKQGKMVEIPY